MAAPRPCQQEIWRRSSPCAAYQALRRRSGAEGVSLDSGPARYSRSSARTARESRHWCASSRASTGPTREAIEVGGVSADVSVAGRRACAGNPGDPPGAGHHRRPVDRRESVSRRLSPRRRRIPRPPRSRAANPRDAVRLRPGEGSLALDARGRSRTGAAPADGDHAGASQGRAPARARRADLFLDRGRGAAAVRQSCGSCAAKASASSTSRTECAR